MDDVDDTTLMQTLRDADPLSQRALDAGARDRLEQSWRQAADLPAAEGRTGRRTTGGYGRRLQLAGVVIALFVVVTGGVMLSNVVAQRGATTQRVGTAEPDAAAVEGSFRARVQRGSNPADTFDVVDGRVHARAGSPQRYATPAVWRGFGDAAPVFVDEQIVSGDGNYIHARAGAQGPARWYRYTGAQAGWQTGPAGRQGELQPDLTETTLPVFTEGARGFRQVEDDEAAAQGLTRYTADVAAADLDFLGWFAPTHGDVNHERSEASIDIWVDTSGRLHRAQVDEVAEHPTITRFDQFDALVPIAAPFGEGDEAPVATDALGVTLTACGDPALADALRQRVTAALDGDEDVVSYETLDAPTREQDRIDDSQMTPDDRLFVVAARFDDDIDFGAAGSDEKMDRLSGLDVGSVNDGSPTSEGYAYLCSTSLESWIELDG